MYKNKIYNNVDNQAVDKRNHGINQKHITPNNARNRPELFPTLNQNTMKKTASVRKGTKILLSDSPFIVNKGVKLKKLVSNANRFITKKHT